MPVLSLAPTVGFCLHPLLSHPLLPGLSLLFCFYLVAPLSPGDLSHACGFSSYVSANGISLL